MTRQQFIHTYAHLANDAQHKHMWSAVGEPGCQVRDVEHVTLSGAYAWHGTTCAETAKGADLAGWALGSCGYGGAP